MSPSFQTLHLHSCISILDRDLANASEIAQALNSESVFVGVRFSGQMARHLLSSRPFLIGGEVDDHSIGSHHAVDGYCLHWFSPDLDWLNAPEELLFHA